jgi:energy-coupling factor transport system substrate-specific component
MRALIAIHGATARAPDPADSAAKRDSRTSPDSSGATTTLSGGTLMSARPPARGEVRSDMPLPHDEPDSLDRIAADLLALKDAASLSYAEIGRRIGDARIRRGAPENAAYPARSTVYDAFRAGRTRVDHALLRDIVRALGADEHEAERWMRRARALRRPAEPAPRGRAASPHPIGGGVRPSASAPRRWFPAALLLGCVALNLLGIVVVQALHLPIYLDMIGTATASIMLGPWHGALVALSSNLLGFTVGAPGAAPFALVNLAGALVWGYGVRRFGMGAGIGRFFVLNLLAATACSLVGAPLGVILFGGLSGHGSDTVTNSIVTMGIPLIAAAFSANILTSVIDKLLTGFIALMIFVWLHRATGFPATHMPLVERLSAPAPLGTAVSA